MIDALFDLREKKRVLEAEASEIGKVMEAKESEILAELELQGLDKATGRKAHVGAANDIVPHIEDWQAFWAYIRRNNAFELLHKRVSVAAWCERAALRRDGTLPGTVPFRKRKLSLTVNQ